MGERDELAQVMHDTYERARTPEGWLSIADAVLASDWLAAHVARATADAEIVRAEWERQYGYAAEAAERFRRQAADAEARLAKAQRMLMEVGAELAAARRLADTPPTTYPPHSDWGQDPSGYCGCRDCSAPDDPAPTTDDDGRDERRDGAGGHIAGDCWCGSHHGRDDFL